MRLYHFTCEHHFAKIAEAGKLVPQPQPLLDGTALTWYTPFAAVSAAELGMTRVMLKCNRMEFRVMVHTADAVPWSTVRGLYPWDHVAMLEGTPGAKPLLWYVAHLPVEVEA